VGFLYGRNNSGTQQEGDFSMDMWQVFNVFVWIFAVIGFVLSLLYAVLTWYVYYELKISSPQEKSTICLLQALQWSLLGIMMVSEMANLELRDRKRRAKIDPEPGG
jgi:hypothetical protein